jgi:hypothetical protein
MKLRRLYLWAGITLDEALHRLFRHDRLNIPFFCKFTDDHFHEYYSPAYQNVEAR